MDVDGTGHSWIPLHYLSSPAADGWPCRGNRFSRTSFPTYPTGRAQARATLCRPSQGHPLSVGKASMDVDGTGHSWIPLHYLSSPAADGWPCRGNRFSRTSFQTYPTGGPVLSSWPSGRVVPQLRGPPQTMHPNTCWFLDGCKSGWIGDRIPGPVSEGHTLGSRVRRAG
jgi:hypothetical protein